MNDFFILKLPPECARKERRTGNDNICAGRDNLTDSFVVHAPVDRNEIAVFLFAPDLLKQLYFFNARRYKFLPAESGVNCHYKNKVNASKNFRKSADRCARNNSYSCFFPEVVVYVMNKPVCMNSAFIMKRNQIGTGLR